MNRKQRNGSSRHVFISYSRKDMWEMRAISNAVRLAGLRVWIDEHLTPGTPNWKEQIGKKLSAASCVVCICSPEARRSKWVRDEIQLAIERKLPVYPMLVSGDPTEAIPASLLSIQFTDCRADYQTAVTKLTEELVTRHRKALTFDMRSLFDPSGVQWGLTGSLFWFASEARKIRLFLTAEQPTSERVLLSVRQLLHHARRLNVDHFSIRDIQNVQDTLKEKDLELLTDAERMALENKVRLVQDKLAGLAEEVDPSFKPGTDPGNPIPLGTRVRRRARLG